MTALQHQNIGTPGDFPVLLHHGLVGSAHVGADWAMAALLATGQ